MHATEAAPASTRSVSSAGSIGLGIAAGDHGALAELWIASFYARDVQFSVLGTLAIAGSGGALKVRRGIPRLLLCVLLLHRNDVVTSDALIGRIWEDDLPGNPANALHTHIAYLRRVLAPTAATIRTTPTGYVLEVDDDLVDAHRFERLVVEGRRLLESGTGPSLVRAVTAFESALALWRGAAYDDAADHTSVRSEATRLDELRVHAAQLRIDALLALGRADDAARDLQPLIDANPLHERFREQAVTALYRAGRQAEALRAYQAARSTLVEELGVEPGPALRRLEQAVIDQSSELDWTRPAGASVETARGTPASTWARPIELIGRSEELARAGELLDRTRLLTLTGPGGGGKTALATELGRMLAQRRPVHFVDLATIERDDDVDVAVAKAVGADFAPGHDAVSALTDVLKDSDAVVVLDTCEHVAHGSARVVAALLRDCPAVSVLATSRRPLDVGGELAWPVPPLSLPRLDMDPRESPAVQLFVRGARTRAPDLDTDAHIGDIAEICRSLDGLPLAIELAAAQVDVLHPTVMRRRLEDQLGLLAADGAIPRQRTLQTTIDWSVRLLDADERDLLGRLTVFVGTFDVDAVVAVADVDGGVAIARLKALVRSSLVAVAGPGRYRLLDTIRAFARELRPTRADVQELHARHFAQVAGSAFQHVRTPAQTEWMERLRADAGNFRAALDWSFGTDGDPALGARTAGSLAWVWTLDGSLAEARAAVARASAVEGLDPEVRALVLLGMGLLAAPLGELDTALAACAESAELARSAGLDGMVADAMITLGVAQWALGDLAAAAATHDEAIRLFRAVGDRWGATVTSVLRARTARDAGDLALAARLLDDLLHDARATGDAHVIGLAFDQVARLALDAGDHARAVYAARECLAANETIGYAEGIASALHVLARSRAGAGDLDAAQDLQLRALGVAHRIGHAGGICESLEMLAGLMAARHDDLRAASLLHHAERIRSRRNVTLLGNAAAAVDALRREVRERLGPGWDDVRTRTPLESPDELIAQLLSDR